MGKVSIEFICQSIRRNRYKRIYSLRQNSKNWKSGSSLIALSVILMVDEEYGITIEGKDIENSRYDRRIIQYNRK